MTAKRKPEITEFQKTVFQATGRIPRGKVSTYKLLAIFIGCGSSQAVGQALKNNPFAPMVPCHRVITSGHRIGGFGGKTSGPKISKKKKLLSSEGVMFDGDWLADPKQIFTYR